MHRCLALLGLAGALALALVPMGGAAVVIEVLRPVFAATLRAGASAAVIDQTSNWTCTTSQDYQLVKVNITNQPNADAINVRSGCSGTAADPLIWERLEIDTNALDGLKVNAGGGNYLQVNGGYIRCHGATTGAHQDAIQALAGTHIVLRNMDVIGCDTQQIIISNPSVGLVCDGCRFYPEQSGDVIPPGNVGSGDNGPSTPMILQGNSGTLNSTVCRSPRRGGGVTVLVDAPPVEWVVVGWSARDTPAAGSGNVLLPVGDPSCVYSGAAPPPSPPPPPPPAYAPACAPTCDERIAELQAKIEAARAALG